MQAVWNAWTPDGLHPAERQQFSRAGYPFMGSVVLSGAQPGDAGQDG